MDSKIRELLSSSPISAVEWVTSTNKEKSSYISRLKKLLTKEDLNNIEKVATAFKSMWKMGEWHKINLKPDEYEARKMKEDINGQVEKMIIEDMVIFKKEGKTFKDWAKDSVWSKDTGGPKDESGAPIRALSGRWKELWKMTGSKKNKRSKKQSKSKNRKKTKTKKLKKQKKRKSK